MLEINGGINIKIEKTTHILITRIVAFLRDISATVAVPKIKRSKFQKTYKSIRVRKTRRATWAGDGGAAIISARGR